MKDVSSVQTLLSESLESIADVEAMSQMVINQLSEVGCKTILRLVERAIFTAGIEQESPAEVKKAAQLAALDDILQDFAGDEAIASRVCSV
jgi:hypothetical protein